MGMRKYEVVLTVEVEAQDDEMADELKDDLITGANPDRLRHRSPNRPSPKGAPVTTQTFVPTAGQIEAMTTTDFVRIAWHHSLHWQTHEITRWEEFEDALTTLNLDAAIGSSGAYGDLMPRMGALQQVFADLSGIVIARECSECLYAFIPYWTHQQTGFQDGQEKRVLNPTERWAIALNFFAVVRSADELSFLGHTAGQEEAHEIEWKGSFNDLDPYRIRAWWD